MPKMDKQTGIILAGGAAALGLILLPGFFSGKGKPKEPELEPELKPMELSPADLRALEAMGEDVPADKKKADKPKKVLIAKGMPTLSVTTGQKSYAALSGIRNRGVGNHMSFPDVDIWNAPYVDIMAKWDIQNPSPTPQTVDMLVSLRLTRDFSMKSFLTGRSYGEVYGRDAVMFEYNPFDGVKFDKFHDDFRQSVETTHGASKVASPAKLAIPANTTKTLLIGLHLPGPSRSDELREFWGANPQFNFRVEAYQGKGSGSWDRLGEHEFKDAFTTISVRPTLIALRSTGDGDSPRLTIRSLG